MKVLYIKNTDPYYNLAAEEYFLKQRDEDFFLLWQNAPCVVVGRNQNTYAQINADFVRANALPVVRRLTGGGAVYHDLGNVNYSVILSNAADRFGDYPALCRPVTDALAALGADVSLSGRNDILADGKKICGNAQTMWHGRILHHGCILFSADLDRLTDALRVDPVKIQSKGIDSVRSRVTNLSSVLPSPMTADGFVRFLYDFALSSPENSPCSLSAADEAEITRLRDGKYATFEWNYGFSKQYSFSKPTRFSGGSFTVNFNVVSDRIADLHIEGDFFGSLELSGLTDVLDGAPYDPDTVSALLEGVPISDYIRGMDKDAFLNALF